MWNNYKRVLKMCSPQYLHDVEKYSENTFKFLQYPIYFRYNARQKAYQILRIKKQR